MTVHHALRVPCRDHPGRGRHDADPTAQTAPLAIDTARVTIAGSSNIHNYSAWTDTVRVTRVKLAAPIAPDAFWDHVVKPGALEGFEVSIPAATLTSPVWTRQEHAQGAQGRHAP